MAAAALLGIAVPLGLVGSPATARADWNGPTLMECANRVLGTGARGACVTSLQKNLEAYGYELETDGRYGHETRLTVMDFQRRHGLAVDGVAGRETMTALDRWANAPHADPEPRSVPDPQRVRGGCDWLGACHQVASRSGTVAFADVLAEWDKGFKGGLKDYTLKAACGATTVLNPAVAALCELDATILENGIAQIVDRAVKEKACLKLSTRPVFIQMYPAIMPDLTVENGHDCTN
ncbi:peptidoglycan-binding domain-containing protein [Streptomyces venetus]